MAAQPFPFTLANLAGGNNPVSDIDANFAVVMRGPASTTQGYIGYWDNTAGTSYAAGYNTTPAFGTIVKVVGVDVSNKLPAVDASNLTNLPAGVVRTYISGLTLSNDSGTPNTILDVAAGTCADSTNAVMITLGAFTKTTGGAWTAGTGNAGMGTGLTIGNSTWYHVFAIINSAVADVYFDTSVTAANAPVGTSSFRRIGSFLTDSSAHIVTFIQTVNEFYWKVPVLESTSANPGTSAVTQTLANVPLGVRVKALLNVLINMTSLFYISDLSTTDEAPSASAAPIATIGSGTTNTASQASVWTSTSATVRTRAGSSGSGEHLYIATLGWIDPRGQA